MDKKGTRVRKLRGVHMYECGIIIDVKADGVKVKLDNIDRVCNWQKADNFEMLDSPNESSCITPMKAHTTVPFVTDDLPKSPIHINAKISDENVPVIAPPPAPVVVPECLSSNIVVPSPVVVATTVKTKSSSRIGHLFKAITRVFTTSTAKVATTMKHPPPSVQQIANEDLFLYGSMESINSRPDTFVDQAAVATGTISTVEVCADNLIDTETMATPMTAVITINAKSGTPSDSMHMQSIHSIVYKYGMDKMLVRRRYTLDVETTDCWFHDKSACYPPEFTPKTVGMFPIICSDASSDAGSSPTVQWGHPLQNYTIEDWNSQVDLWQSRYPNIKEIDGSNPHETESYRSKQTSNIDIIRKCWDVLPTVVPSKYTGKVRKILSNFRVDMYGNVICLPDKLPDGLASNSSLTFYDIDHIFPYCRGGRSVLRNFAAVQNVANRTVKSDNMVQMLSPIDMKCGITHTQLLAMVDWVLGNMSKERNTTAMYLDKIVGWLTKGPPNKASYVAFQKDVAYTLDGRTLMQYFGSRDMRENSYLITDVVDVRQKALVADPCDAYMQVRCTHHSVEAFNSTTKMFIQELKANGFSWDGSVGRWCWCKEYTDEAHREGILQYLHALATAKAVGIVHVT